MLQNLGKLQVWKYGICFFYIFIQILTFSALLMTNSYIIANVVIMILTVGLYFAVCFKDPGVFIANPQPNLEDIDSKSHNATKKIDHQSKIRKIKSEDIQQAKQDQVVNLKKNTQTLSKPANRKTSLQNLALDQEIHQPHSVKQQKAIKADEQLEPNKNKQLEKSLNIPSNKFLEKAIGMFGMITSFMSKNNIPEIQQQKTIPKTQDKEQKPQEIVKQTKQEQVEQVKIYLNNHQYKPQEENDQKGFSKEQDFETQNIQQQFMCSDKLQPRRCSKNISLVKKISEIKRYCRICQIYQPLRVRHCHSCDQCISTFDHHCPWLGTCIGQKNKLLFMIYLFFQDLQLIIMLMALIRYLSKGSNENNSSVAVLLISIILFTVMMTLLFAFHAYLICNNITTWQMFRWQSIEYLQLFDREKIVSPFSKGVNHNLKMLWSISWNKQQKKWSEELTQQLATCVKKRKRSKATSQRQQETDRKMYHSHQIL